MNQRQGNRTRSVSIRSNGDRSVIKRPDNGLNPIRSDRKIHSLQIIEKLGSGRCPVERLARPRARHRKFQADERTEPARCAARHDVSQVASMSTLERLVHLLLTVSVEAVGSEESGWIPLRMFSADVRCGDFSGSR